MPVHSNRKVIVLVVDRLSPSQIGAYGNTCHTTDSIDQIASQSILFDQCVSPIANLESSYRQLFAAQSNSSTHENWLQTLTASGVETRFFSDRQWLTEVSAIDDFESVRHLSIKSLDRLASRSSQTWLARYFAQALDCVESMPNSGLVWLDCSGLSRQWDAPYALRQQLADPDDPAPPEYFQPPNFVFDVKADDPDDLLGVQQAADAQVRLLDDFVGVLVESLSGTEFESTLFCLTSLRGYPVGQHGLVGDPEGAEISSQLPLRFNFGESVHVPLLVRLPKWAGDVESVRSGRLVTPKILPDLIQAFLTGQDDRVQSWIEDRVQLPAEDREVVLFENAGEVGIQTHAWKLIQNLQSDHNALFAKPDDVGEVNDVSDRCPGEVQRLSELLQQLLVKPDLSGSPDFSIPEDLIARHG